MDKTYFSVLAIGQDSPGIAAAVSGVLARRFGCNVETSQMTIVSGYFAVALIASSEAPLDHDGLARALEDAGDEPGLRHVAVRALEDFSPSPRLDPTVAVMAKVTERPGVLDEIATALAAHDVNITSLSSVCSAKEASVCIVNLDVSLPDGMSREELESILFDSVQDDISFVFDELPPRRRR
jgi:glycine cleavage system regulatory protein